MSIGILIMTYMNTKAVATLKMRNMIAYQHLRQHQYNHAIVRLIRKSLSIVSNFYRVLAVVSFADEVPCADGLAAVFVCSSLVNGTFAKRIYFRLVDVLYDSDDSGRGPESEVNFTFERYEGCQNRGLGS